MAGKNMNPDLLRKSIPMQTHTLANGLRIVMFQSKKAPIASINLSYRVGSKDERDNKTGFAHLFEHLMFEGSRNVPKGEFDKLCSSAGGTNNAYTTYDWTSYEMTVPRHQLELAFWLESDRMFNFELTEEALENQKKVVTEEIRQTVENQPYGRWRESLAENAYSAECSYSWEVHGRKEDVAGCTMEDASGFFNSFYRPDNACLAIAGDIEFDEVLELAKKYFEKKPLAGSKPPRREYSHQYELAGRSARIEDVSPLCAVFLGFHSPGFLDDSVFIAEIIANAASTGRSSILYNTLVYNRQIASQVGAFADKREHDTLLTFYAIANDTETTADALYAALKEQVDMIAGEGIDESRLKRTKAKLATQMANEIQYSSGIVDIACNLELFLEEPGKLFEMMEIYKKISYRDTADFAAKYLVDGNMIRIDVVPKAEQ